MSAEAAVAPRPGLYLHVPFCARICPYCDFAVTTGSRGRRAAFVDSLVSEIGLWQGERGGFDTIYFGGGTPSTLLPEEIGRILETARGALEILPGARLFLEANPEDVTAESAAAWRALGVSTVSLGIQSFDAANLAFLGRRHGPEEARASVRRARAAGFETVSLDVIYGLPGQGPEAWRRELAAAVRLAPDHISCYQLTFHEETPFGRRLARGALAELPEAEQAELFALTHSFLADAGYEGYEVSSFARAPEHRSRHNRKYWDHTPYLGLGPSAHSFSGLSGRQRWWNERNLADWQGRVARGERPVAGSEELSAPQLALEALMLGLRTRAGIDLGSFRERYGVDLAAGNAGLIARLAGEGLVERPAAEPPEIKRPPGGRLAPTLRGLAVADTLARLFDVGS